MKDQSRFNLELLLPHLDGATASWLVDLFGHLQHAIWQAYGDEIEAHWTITDPEQPIYGRLSSPQRRKR